MNYDVAVVGAGVIGSLIARDLKPTALSFTPVSMRSPAPSKHAST